MLDSNIQFLKGVGPSRALKLQKLDIFTIGDLFNYLPVKYEDRRRAINLNEIREPGKYLLKVKIFEKPKHTRLKKSKTMIKVVCKDDTGFITLTFFNNDFIMDKLIVGEWYNVFGNVKIAFGKFEATNPEIESADRDWKAGRIMPVYGLTYGLSNNEITKLVKTAFETYYDSIQNILPEEIIMENKLISRKEALLNLHFPSDLRKYSSAKKTLAFEKLLIMQLGLFNIKSNFSKEISNIKIENRDLAERLLRSLPYKLTNAQLKVIEEINVDLKGERVMNRLVQGDVGSGKTVVAVYAMLLAVSSGYQASMMAPTEILALQHYETIKECLNLAGIDIKAEVLTGSTKAKEKQEILRKLRDGDLDIIVGTHALIEDDVVFNNIGLVVTDEQHRFGVRQRAKLSNKGRSPHIMVMTATPIPRTLALMIYGDLDISLIDEMPPGRQKVITYVIGEEEKIRAYDFIKKHLDRGRQAYIIAPLVEESENLDLNSAVDLYEELKSSYFSGYELGLLHGKMSSGEKEEVINKFYEGKISGLISTTVVEVGVNVPNATIMMILNAERFGLAQLHQLRGRVGRGKFQSYCILVNESKSKKSRDRMNILKSTNNGFIIAEEDLKIRGPGDFFGIRQHGLSKFDIQNIVNDVETLQQVQLLTRKIMAANPSLTGAGYRNLKQEITKLFKDETIVFN